MSVGRRREWVVRGEGLFCWRGGGRKAKLHPTAPIGPSACAPHGHVHEGRGGYVPCSPGGLRRPRRPRVSTLSASKPPGGRLSPLDFSLDFPWSSREPRGAQCLPAAGSFPRFSLDFPLWAFIVAAADHAGGECGVTAAGEGIHLGGIGFSSARFDADGGPMVRGHSSRSRWLAAHDWADVGG